ncbi:MAG: hypothetical protein WDW38_004265 [Sanguina aurantia]
MSENKVTLIIKSQAHCDFTLQVTPADTVASLKKRLFEEYFGKPCESDQTLIYAGKVLKDKSVTIQDLVGQHDSSLGSGPYNLHLVVKQSAAGSHPTHPPPVSQPAPEAASESTGPPHQPAAAAVQAAGSRRAVPPPPQPLPPPVWSPSGPPEAPAPAPQPTQSSPESQQAPTPAPAQPPRVINGRSANGAAASPAHQAANHRMPAGVAAHGPPPAPIPAPQSHPTGAFHNPYTGVDPVMADAYAAAYSAALTVARRAAALGQTQLPPLTSTPSQQHITLGGQSYALVPLQMLGPGGTSASSNPWAVPGLLGPHTLLPDSVFSSCYAAGAPSSAATAAALAAALQGCPHSGNSGSSSSMGPADAAQTMRAVRGGERPAVVGGVGEGAAGVAAAAAQNAMADAAGLPRGMLGREVRRVFLLRIPITTRSLLQLLVFAVVLYQHFTWQRCLALLFGGILFYLTAVWTPLRRMMVALMHGTPRTAQQAGQHPAAVAPQNRGMLSEILIFLAGFITSLLPAWNYNPDEAAAFAAAQLAEQQQQAAADGAAGAAAAAAQPLEAGAPLADEEPVV